MNAALATRQVMGGEIDYGTAGRSHDGDLAFHLLGMLDYEGEMRLLCREYLA